MQKVWDLFNLEEPPKLEDEFGEQLMLALSHDARMGSHGHGLFDFMTLFKDNLLLFWLIPVARHVS